VHSRAISGNRPQGYVNMASVKDRVQLQSLKEVSLYSYLGSNHSLKCVGH
jgi:hypothetical protein